MVGRERIHRPKYEAGRRKTAWLKQRAIFRKIPIGMGVGRRHAPISSLWSIGRRVQCRAWRDELAPSPEQVEPHYLTVPFRANS